MTGWAAKILRRDPRALARACTLIENRTPDSAEILRSFFAHTGKALIAGITGPPGAGKSTLTGELITCFRQAGLTVAIIAVDPSSPFSGGAILGDRIRMQQHYADPGVFVRSMATRGTLGGLAPATLDLSLLLDAAGFDVILIETVGAGQDEVDVASVASLTVLVLNPNSGDEVQAIKAGVLEIASLIVINKADLPGAAQLELDLGSVGVPVLKTIATQPQGVGELAAAMRALPVSPTRHTELWKSRLRDMLRERILMRLSGDELAAAAHDVATRVRDPYSILDNWMKRLFP